ncbi:MAG: potassium-transporting ATPase KdpC subunit [Solirubrobacteraceae bacterium]|jgi:K+-transporting ATPase ATPase C chain|nr:potassium-transporting ATPase KdpC subunit [Solirubrobacteraceae bacterium]
MRRDLISSTIAIVALTLLLGLAYPLVVTGVSQVLFPGQADGSQVVRNGRVVGSALLGQDFAKDRSLFQSRPSPTGYNPAGTAFSNLGPNSKDLRAAITRNADAYLRRERPYNPGLSRAAIPADAVQTSASGVDPHISVANARIQAGRVAARTRLPKARVLALLDANTDGRGLGFLGEPGVNVLRLNLAIQGARR